MTSSNFRNGTNKQFTYDVIVETMMREARWSIVMKDGVAKYALDESKVREMSLSYSYSSRYTYAIAPINR